VTNTPTAPVLFQYFPPLFFSFAFFPLPPSLFFLTLFFPRLPAITYLTLLTACFSIFSLFLVLQAHFPGKSRIVGQYPAQTSLTVCGSPIFARSASLCNTQSKITAQNAMGRTVDQEVHAAFVEFRAKEDDKARDRYRGNYQNINTNLVYYRV
jgi:hypothetical protein